MINFDLTKININSSPRNLVNFEKLNEISDVSLIKMQSRVSLFIRMSLF